jgi:hypothetical protein
MRLLGAVVLLVLLAAWPAQAAIAVVQETNCSSEPSASCTTPSIASTTGHLFVVSVGFCCTTGDHTSITDSHSNPYGLVIAEFASGSAFAMQYATAGGTGGATHTFTSNHASAGVYATISVLEVSGAAASPLDQTQTGIDAVSCCTAHSSTSTATTAQANELLLGFGSTTDASTFTTDTGAGWTERTNIASDGDTEGLITGSRVVAATGTYAYTWTTNVATRAVSGISTWKEATAVGVRQRCVGCGSDPKVIE